MAASGSSASTKKVTIANYEWAWPRVSAYVAYANVSSPSIVRIARWRRWRSLRLILESEMFAKATPSFVIFSFICKVTLEKHQNESKMLPHNTLVCLSELLVRV